MMMMMNGDEGGGPGRTHRTHCTRIATPLHLLSRACMRHSPSLSPHSGPAVADAIVAAWRAQGAAARAAAGPRPPRRPVIDPDATYESLLMSKEPFPVPISLDVSVLTMREMMG